MAQFDPNAPGAVPPVGGSPSPLPPTGATQPPMLNIPPEQLDMLQKRGMISASAAMAARARMGLLDAKLGLDPSKGFSQMLTQPGLEGAPAPQQQPALKPGQTVEKRKPAKQKLTPEQEKQAVAWEGLVGKVTWVNPREMPVGAQIEMPAQKLPKAAIDLMYQMNPEAKAMGYVPYGWTNVAKLPDNEKAVMAQLLLVAERERQARMLADQQMRMQLQQQGVPIPPEMAVVK